MKIKPHIFVLLAVLLCVGMIIPPVCAEELSGYMLNPLDTLDQEKIYFNDVFNLSYDASTNGDAINLIHFKVPMDATVSFTIYTYQENLTGSATTYWNLSVIPPTTTTSSITFSGETKAYNYLDTNPEFDYFLSGYAKELATNTTGIIVYNAGYGSFDNDLSIFHPTGNIASNLIYRVDLACDEPFDVDISYAPTDAVAAAASKSWLEIAYEWMALAVGLAFFLKDFVMAIFVWVRFLFVDNLFLTIGLYIGVSMAYSAISSRNIFDFYKKFFKFQRSMFGFMMELWNYLVQIVSAFRGIFRI